MRKDRKIDRREALKLMAAGSGLAASSLHAATNKSELKGGAHLSHPASHKYARIVIAGGGTAGIIAAARTRRAAPNAEITLISPNTTHLYQPGALFRAAGLMSQSEMVRETASFFPDNVTWLQEKVTGFDPEHNRIETEKSGKLPYDVLIVALGCAYDYGAIEGMDSSMIGKEGILSIYLNDTVKGTAEGAELSGALFEKMKADVVTASKPLEILFCEPDTPVKGKGSGLSLMLLYLDMLQKKGGDKKVRFTYVTPDEVLLDEKMFNHALGKIVKKYPSVEVLYRHRLTKVDAAAKKATLTSGDQTIEKAYDYIHITPPMQAHRLVRESALAVGDGPQKGW
ncbi:MAG TPA: pyridine nucleotide-disulfide oxidoreductase, partial [Campylobacteraceae bacterium]|nr:pyridine nucleotide-disulfide oxidoreductase [Campylobacteraceae bacterium]